MIQARSKASSPLSTLQDFDSALLASRCLQTHVGSAFVRRIQGNVKRISRLETWPADLHAAPALDRFPVFWFLVGGFSCHLPFLVFGSVSYALPFPCAGSFRGRFRFCGQSVTASRNSTAFRFLPLVTRSLFYESCRSSRRSPGVVWVIWPLIL